MAMNATAKHTCPFYFHKNNYIITLPNAKEARVVVEAAAEPSGTPAFGPNPHGSQSLLTDTPSQVDSLPEAARLGCLSELETAQLVRGVEAIVFERWGRSGDLAIQPRLSADSLGVFTTCYAV